MRAAREEGCSNVSDGCSIAHPSATEMNGTPKTSTRAGGSAGGTSAKSTVGSAQNRQRASQCDTDRRQAYMAHLTFPDDRVTSCRVVGYWGFRDYPCQVRVSSFSPKPSGYLLQDSMFVCQYPALERLKPPRAELKDAIGLKCRDSEADRTAFATATAGEKDGSLMCEFGERPIPADAPVMRTTLPRTSIFVLP